MKKNKGKIAYSLQAVGIFPLLLLGIMIMVLGYRLFTEAMYNEVEQSLQGAAANAVTLLNTVYPGDFSREGEGTYRYYKGDEDITDAFELLDQVKEDSGLEVTLFYQNTRILTTIYDASGERFVGTNATNTVRQEVLKGKQARFYTDVVVDGVTYFSYYMPLYNSDGKTAGILFVGKPRDQVDAAVQNTLYPLLVAVFLTILVMSYIIFHYTKGIVGVLLKIRAFLSKVSGGDMDAEIDPTVLERNDELGEMGQSAVAMQQAIREMVELDPLTKLLNRSSADRKLRLVMEKSVAQKTPFAVAIGDIDFFKKVNDTYGHDCGDIVLKQVAATLQEYMQNVGFVARWGGEEFLLVFKRLDGERAKEHLEKILDAIRGLRIPYQDQVVSLTMTFGVTDGKSIPMKDLLCKADHNLYEGKESGRNKIVYW